MINLIPPKGEGVVRREYILRVSATYAVLLGCTVSVFAIGLVPIYILVQAHIGALKVEAATQTDTELLKRAEGEIREIKEVLAQLRSQEQTVHASTVFKNIETLAPGGVTFKTLTCGYDSDTITTIIVTGTATTRETLIRFKKALETSETFSSAEVPIADLAKDTNLPFTMTISLTPQP